MSEPVLSVRNLSIDYVGAEENFHAVKDVSFDIAPAEQDPAARKNDGGRAVEATPLRRLVTRAEIAEMVALLCSSAFDIVVGQTIVMDGGRSLPRIAQGP